MKQPLQDVSEQSLIRAIEENVQEFLLELGRLGGGEERDEPGIQWIIGGSPIDYHNCVVRANLVQGQIDETVETLKQQLQAHQVPGTWHIGPSTRPLNLGKLLMERGFTYGGDEPGMAADLLALNRELPMPADFVVERVSNEQELQIWTRILGMGFGAGEIEANWVGEMYHKAGFDEQGAWHHFLGLWRGEPVATTTLFLGAGVAGIYFVFTLPQARRQGIGAAVTLAALQDAQKRGYRIGVLGASQMGYPVYQRLGFQQYCTMSLYEWKP